MSSASAAAGGSSGLSTLSTSLLAAFCTAVVAASIFFLVALRRYLKARKRRSMMSIASAPPATAEAIYTSHVKSKSISTDDIGKPHLKYAPERAHNARYDLTRMSLAQKTVVSMRQQGFLPPKAFASPKFPKAALLSPRMQPPLSADLPPPRTPLSPGLTELTMSPGPSILLKPMTYGKSPNLSLTPRSDVHEEKKEDAIEQKKKLTRSNIPSMLLRSLGVLPDTSGASKETLVEDKEDAMTKDADEPSLTPILDLGIDFGHDESFEQSLQLRSDFSFAQTDNPWTASPAPTPSPNNPKSPAMVSLIEALSPQPDADSLPSFKTSPSAAMATLPTSASTRSHVPTPPPTAGLPPAPASTQMYKAPSSSSLHSKASRATAKTASSAADSFHSATGSIGAICINMPTLEAEAYGGASSDVEDEVSLPYRPLSLGLGPPKSPSQNTFTKIIGSLRKVPSRSEDIDLEAASSSIHTSSTSRSFSSEAMSYSSSQTSMDIEANTSFGKANVVPAASMPPLPPMPMSLLKYNEEQTPNSKSTTVPAAQVETPRRPRKRASTLGALDQPKLVMPDLMHPRAAPLPPGVSPKMASPSINVESVEVNRVSLGQLKSRSSDHLPLKSNGKGAAMNFTSPYHRALLADPPTDGMRLSPGLGADSPILAQLSPKMLGNSPSLSPKPSFTESLKARLSLKSLTGSPSFNSRNSTPRMDTINQFPKPNGDGFSASEAPEATPKVKSSAKQNLDARPATSPNLGQSEVGLGISSPAILFNGQEIEPTRPLRFKKPSSAGGRLGGSPSSLLSPALPSPMLHAGGWGAALAQNESATNATPSEAFYSPLIVEEGSPSGERIEFGALTPMSFNDAVSSPMSEATPAAPSSSMLGMASANEATTPELDASTPRPNSSSDSGAFADEEPELEYLSNRDSIRDSMVSVAASTISIMSNSTCMSDSVGEDLEQAADRRARLLATVQQNLAKSKAKDAKRESNAVNRFRKSQMPQSSSLRSIPEALSGGEKTMGLGLFESEEEEAEEEEEEEDEEKEQLTDSPQSYGRRKPDNLVLMPQHDSRHVDPLTPPLTPVDANNVQKQSRHAPTPSTSSASSVSSYSSIPRRMRPSQRGLAPIDTGMANRLSPATLEVRDGAGSPSSLKLRPLSLAASLHGSGDSSPMKRNRSAFSPALSPIPSPGLAHVAGLNDRSSRYNEEGRSSRSTTYRHGGVLPINSSKGALDTGRAGHAEPSLTHSDSTTSMGSMTSSLGSFSKMGNFPSPVKSSFSYNTGKNMAMRPELSHSTSNQSFASSTAGRLGYKTSDLSVHAI